MNVERWIEWLGRHRLLVGAALVLLLLTIFVYVGGLEETVEDETQDLVGYGGPHSDDPSGGRSLFHSGVPIGGRKSGESYGAFDRRRTETSTEAYLGFGCVGSCSEHAAGYRWAAENNVSRPGDCVGRSWAFVEGCAAYVIPHR